MKKKILTILSVFSIVANLTACNSATEAVKEPETAKNWEVRNIITIIRMRFGELIGI